MTTMVFTETLKEARAAARKMGGTYRKVSGGWLAMTWYRYNTWKKQK